VDWEAAHHIREDFFIGAGRLLARLAFDIIL